MLSYFPKYFTQKAIFLYIIVLVGCSVIFYEYALPLIWLTFGLVEVVGFFYVSNKLTQQWALYSEKKFKKNIFRDALILRLVWVFFSYYFFSIMANSPFGFEPGDVLYYHSAAIDLVQTGFNYRLSLPKAELADCGYPTYLALVYFIFGSGLIIPRILKAIYSAITCVLIYKIAKNNFGEAVGRMSGIFCMLMPNLIYYTGYHLKESEMVFLIVWFIERVDHLIQSQKFNFKNIILPILLLFSLFFFRTVLGIAALISVFCVFIFSSAKIITPSRRFIMIIFSVIVMGYLATSVIMKEINNAWEGSESNQTASMQWRSNRGKFSNKFAKYASESIFAPLIFVIPFPTIVEVLEQENQKMINGGNYVKNILAFFVIFTLLHTLKNKKWRDFILIGSFVISYLLILSMSAFAQSERFHQPVLPFEMIMAAYGISLVTNKTKKYFMWYMVFIFVAIISWSWFKLAGRGLI